MGWASILLNNLKVLAVGGVGGSKFSPTQLIKITKSALSKTDRALFMPSTSTSSWASSRRPAVSTNSTGNPPRSRVTLRRSRVVPGESETIATSSRAKRFNKVDLPQLGGPNITTLRPSLILEPTREPSSNKLTASTPF